MNEWKAAEFLSGNDMPQLFGLREPSGDGSTHGKSGEWSWTVNPDGTADLFRMQTGSITNTSAYGSMYFSTGSMNFPPELGIKSIVSATATMEASSGLHCVSIQKIDASKVSFYMFSPTSGTFNVTINFHARVRL